MDLIEIIGRTPNSQDDRLRLLFKTVFFLNYGLGSAPWEERKKRNLQRTNKHLANDLFQKLPTGKRLHYPITKTARHPNSFFPLAISFINQED